MSTYTDQRDAILIHAVGAATAVASDWTDVQIGAPIPRGNRCVRVFYMGESTPPHFGEGRVLNGSMIAEQVGLVAFWAMSTLDEDAVRALDDEMVAFKHQLRTRVLGDSQLGGKATDLYMGYAEPDWVQIGGARYAVIEITFTLEYTEYPLAP
jgi:hypothetical protein